MLSKISNPESQSTYLLSISEEETISTLGLIWQPSIDYFKFVFKPWLQPLHLTKRSLLPDINRNFDLVGFLSPVFIRCKVFMQQLWSLQFNWNTPLPTDMQQKLIQFYQGLRLLEQLTIPVLFTNNNDYIYYIQC